MSKTVKIEIYIAGIGVARATGTAKKITPGEVLQFKAKLPEYQSQAKQVLTPMLKRAGFIIDPALWQYKLEMSANGQHLYYLVILTFADDHNEGKQKFMQAINDTGILKLESEIVKPYG